MIKAIAILFSVTLIGCAKPLSKSDLEIANAYCESKGESLVRVNSTYAAGHDLSVACRKN